MALDLYVNHERCSNSSKFYRLAGSKKYSFVLKLVDTEISQYLFKNFLNICNVEVSVNGSPYTQAFVNTNTGQIYTSSLAGEDGRFGSYSVNSSNSVFIGVRIYVNDIAGTFHWFLMEIIFVNRFPTFDWIAYPSMFIDETANKSIQLSQNNWKFSPGLFFYGEGHTERINLSVKPEIELNSTDSIVWLVGNSPLTADPSLFIGEDAKPETKDHSATWSNIASPCLFPSKLFTSSVLPVSSITNKEAFIDVKSQLNRKQNIPISARIVNSQFPLDGPVVTYDDQTGKQRFYPHFKSSLNIFGKEVRERYKSNIYCLLYPLNDPPKFYSPFETQGDCLLLNNEPHTFRASIIDPPDKLFTYSELIETSWELKAKSVNGTWQVSTPFLPYVSTYQFELGYDKEDIDWYLPLYKASLTSPTTVDLIVTAKKRMWINIPPYDWGEKDVLYTLSASNTFSPIPFTDFKIYTPNFFYLKEQEVPILITKGLNSLKNITSLKIESPQSKQHIVFNEEQLSYASNTEGYALTGTLKFDVLGPIDLVFKGTARKMLDKPSQNINFTLANILEIVSEFDTVKPNLYKTSLTPLSLTFREAPKISPNEWLESDLANAVFEHFHVTLQELIDYTTLYVNVSKMYGQLCPEYIINKKTSIPNPVYNWQDLGAEGVTTWDNLKTNTIVDGISWNAHAQEISQTQTNPSCIQKHCLDWRWRFRTKDSTSSQTTWRKTRKGGALAKKWRKEKCEKDNIELNCFRTEWKLETLKETPDFIYSNSRCNLIDVDVLPSGHYVIAHPTEFNVLSDDSYGTLLARESIADDEYAFQEIVAAKITSEQKIVVLDKKLSKVCVYDLETSPYRIIPFVQWGGFGGLQDPRGFNSPSDLYVDFEDAVWVCDTGNKCVKKLSMLGVHYFTINDIEFETNPPLSICCDSNLNFHVLTKTKVVVFDRNGKFLTNYNLSTEVRQPLKIQSSFNKECIYITHLNGLIKYFRTGTICYSILSHEDARSYGGLHQDKFRNLLITCNTILYKIADLQKIQETKLTIPSSYLWALDDIKIAKEEYVQPFVYLKSFHRLWDNIELLRNSLFYDQTGCKQFVPPTYSKEDLIIGQNEIVTNAVFNRLCDYLWTNISSLFPYFGINCEK